MKKLTIILPDQVYKNAIRKATQTGIEVPSYISGVVSDKLLSSELINLQVNDEKYDRSIIPNIPDTLDQVLDVCDLVWNHEKEFSEAVDIVAVRKGVQNGTVRDKCTRRISVRGVRIINTNIF